MVYQGTHVLLFTVYSSVAYWMGNDPNTFKVNFLLFRFICLVVLFLTVLRGSQGHGHATEYRGNPVSCCRSGDPVGARNPKPTG